VTEKPRVAAAVPPIGLSTSSVFPENTERGFALAAELGYDGVEVMVTADRVSQDATRLADMSKRYGVPVLSVHSPCLAISARVWGTDPVGKIARSLELAVALGARTVVAHPPFVWQYGAAKSFPSEVAEFAAATDVVVAIENMYPLPVLGVPVSTYRPHWDVARTGYAAYTLDLSHTAVAGVDAVEAATTMGGRLAHLHLGDGTGAPRDEHLVPGRGRARCAEVLRMVAAGSVGRRDEAGRFAGAVILEVSTRTQNRPRRAADLAEARAFARQHLGRS
jgi:sugar phosphate isomerase/epimerase